MRSPIAHAAAACTDRRPSMNTIVLGVLLGVARPSLTADCNRKYSGSRKVSFPCGIRNTLKAMPGRSIDVRMTSVWYMRFSTRLKPEVSRTLASLAVSSVAEHPYHTMSFCRMVRSSPKSVNAGRNFSPCIIRWHLSIVTKLMLAWRSRLL
jgi:hypothetical protein